MATPIDQIDEFELPEEGELREQHQLSQMRPRGYQLELIEEVDSESESPRDSESEEEEMKLQKAYIEHELQLL